MMYSTDIDECIVDPPPQDFLCNNGTVTDSIPSKCVNTPGNYTCQCPDGYHLDNDSYACTGRIDFLLACLID